MNPEPHPAPASDAPNEVPAVANPTASTQAPVGAGPSLPGDDAAAGPPDTVPDPLAEVSSVSIAAQSPVAAPELSPAAESTTAAALSPAACGARLAELFPALFAAPTAPGPAKPIKLRIHADIQARAPGVFTKRMLGIFFSRYTTSNAYLKALASAPHRFDLDGQPAGEIAAEHRQAATEELARRHALAAERRAAQRPLPRRDTPRDEGDAALAARRGVRPERQHAARAAVQPDARAHTPPARRHPERPQHDRPPAHQRTDAPPTPRPTPVSGLPSDAAQRERALLLRSFESSPLSKANFCALKRISEAELDAALAQAQAERGGPSKAAPRNGTGR